MSAHDVKRGKCPTCGSTVVVQTMGEGTAFYLPANPAEMTEAIIDRDCYRAALEEIANADFRGNRSWESQHAYKALQGRTNGS